MTKPNLLFLKNTIINDEILNVVNEHLLYISKSRQVGSSITQLINKTLKEIESSNDFNEVCKLARKYYALRQLRTANIKIGHFPGLNNVKTDLLGTQIIRENEYVIYDYTEGVWTYRAKTITPPFARITFSKHHKNIHVRISKMLAIAYPVKNVDRPYVICDGRVNESMTSVFLAEMNEYVGFLKEEKMIMDKLIKLYKVSRGFES